MSRLLLVSNRLPVTVSRMDGVVTVEPSMGGLATGLSGPHRDSDGWWIGWPGALDDLGPEERGQVLGKLQELRLLPIELSEEEVKGYYEGFSNRVLWPLFHYLLDHIPEEPVQWRTYAKVNERFADLVASIYREGDRIWIHDYHLCLLPKLLREAFPRAKIGFFLHIPFPAMEVLQALPWRNELLEGLLGADLVGFHTTGYQRNFSRSLSSLLGLPATLEGVRFQDREVRFATVPMGVDARRFAANAADPEVEAHARRIREENAGQVILLGIDRLDYTKGLTRRLAALERLLERHAELREKVHLIQIAVPSRTRIEDYAESEQRVAELVGRINGAFSTERWTPVRYFHRGFTPRELAAFYRAADVMLVTPVRDGMNLVAKEYVACRVGEDGVLVLSELAGAAAELGEALLVNPYDVDGMERAIHRAIEMSEEEQRVRMRALRRRVFAADVHWWARTFLDYLDRSGGTTANASTYSSDEDLERALGLLAAARHRVLFLDLDGTLIRFQGVPELARPDEELLELLRVLSRLPRTTVHVVSGRKREFLAEWLSDLDLTLHAEHGLWTRDPGGPWRMAADVSVAWKESFRPVMERFADETPGAFVEEKTASLGFHYRLADLEFGELQAGRLHEALRPMAEHDPVEILPGDKILEVRARGVDKGMVVAPALERVGPLAMALAMGDDRTDEDLFAALPADGLAIHVGPRPSAAPLRIRDVAGARAFLARLVQRLSRPGNRVGARVG